MILFISKNEQPQNTSKILFKQSVQEGIDKGSSKSHEKKQYIDGWWKVYHYILVLENRAKEVRKPTKNEGENHWG